MDGTGRVQRALHTARRRLALGISVLMVASLLQAFAAAPSAAADGPPEVPGAEVPIPGQDGLDVTPRPDDHRDHPVSAPPPADLPDPGRAEVTVPTSTGPLSVPTPAESLPVSLRADRGLTADVAILDRHAGAGIGGPLLSVTVTSQELPAPPRAVNDDSLDVLLDYSSFAGAYGGGYGSRLTFVALPACFLETPDEAECQQRTPVVSHNNTGTHVLTARDLTLEPGESVVLAAVAQEGGDEGDFSASDLSASATWETDLNTGDFTWSHDLPVPEVPGGLEPALGLTYSSASIDGRTGGTNNQGTWVGDGFDLSPGFIERKYQPCGYDDVEDDDGHTVGDLCWDHDNAFLSLNGAASELVPEDDSTWRLRRDDGTVVELLTDSDRENGTYQDEYWRVTDPDGVRYYFGYHRLPGWSSGDPVTESAWTVPVYGNDAGDPCYAADIEDAWCQQGWRWNLDYVVDPRGNAAAYYYEPEENSYGRFLDEEDNTRYTRGGTLDRVEYGLHEDDVASGTPLARVDFTTSDRCMEDDDASGDDADCSDIDDDPRAWYDTPWDLNCDADEDCDAGRHTPTFWSTQRLTEITTEVNLDDDWERVDSWELKHHWGSADVDYQLLPSSIQHTGHTASSPITLPPTTFGYTQLTNRLDEVGDGYAPFVKARLSSVADEVGGQVDVEYSAPVCDAENLPTPETNTTRCFPQYLAGGPDHDPDLQWFNKYVTTSVTVTDRTGGAPDQITRYQYVDDAAWHYDDNGLVPEEERTWSQWRGHGHVRELAGSQTEMLSQQDTYFLRGMDGDRLNEDGGSKSVEIPLAEGEGDPITDHPSAAGYPYKSVQFSGVDGDVLGKEVSRPWHHRTVEEERDWGTLAADLTGTEHSRTWLSLDDGAGEEWRSTEQRLTHDTVAGRVTEVDDRGEVGTDGDERCARVTYAGDDDADILTLPAREEVVAVACSAEPDRAEDVLTDTWYAYDGNAHGAAGTYGDVTGTAILHNHDGTTAEYRESAATYDDYGRVLSQTDLAADLTSTDDKALERTERDDSRTATTEYAPATGFATTITETTPPAAPDDPSTAQTTEAAMAPERGMPVRLTDTNVNVTDLEFDALGRESRVWLADRHRSNPPTYEFTYTITEGEPVAVGTTTLGNDGQRHTAYTLLDGLLRERQTQEPGPDGGRLLTDIRYDARGLVSWTHAPYYATGTPTTDLFLPEDADSVESQTRHTYDGLGREIEERLIAGSGDGGDVLAVTETVHGGDRFTVVPPDGGTTTTRLFDARGLPSEIRHHHEPDVAADYDSTVYTHTPAGELASVTDPVGNEWTYRYDQLGQEVQRTDPDTGTTTSVYDDRGQLLSTTDENGDTLAHVYDDLGREIELRDGAPDGELRAEWEYDTLPGAQGELARSTRWEDGEPYVDEVVRMDQLYRPLNSRVVIPESEGALAGSYGHTVQYHSSGEPMGYGYPAAGDLPGQTTVIEYEDDTLRPVGLSGMGLQASTTYSLTGKPLQHELSHDGGPAVWATHTYEWGTQRLETARVDRLEQPGVDRHETYDYDPAGNVLSITDVSRTGTDVQCFTYDHLRRLTEAWAQGEEGCAGSGEDATVGGPAPYHHAYTYDEIGNRLTETLHEQDITRSYGYSDDQPRAVTEVVEDAPGVRSLEEYSYDALGNTTARQVGGDSQELTWTPEGRVETVSDGDGDDTEYVYDADGDRLISRGDSETTLYLGHTEVTVRADSDTPSATRYVDAGGGHMVVLSDDGTASFTLADHQATGQLAVDTQSQEVVQRRTLPFGGVRGKNPSDEWPGSRGFVGGIDDVDTGLTHLQTREYDSALGRFLSPDPVMDLEDPQQLQGYAYSNNSPKTFSDPTGLFLGDVIDTINRVSNVIRRGASALSSAMSNMRSRLVSGARDFVGGAVQGAIDLSWKTSEGAHLLAGDQASASTLRAQRLGIIPQSPLHVNPHQALSNTFNKGDENSLAYKLGELFAELTYPWIPGAGMAMSAPIKATSRGGAKAAASASSRQTAKAGAPGAARSGATKGGGASGAKAARGNSPAAQRCADNSFLPGTHVLMADGTTVPIEEVEIGDEVLATDPETGESSPRTVTAEILGEGHKELVTIVVAAEDGTESSVTATDGHPFWVPNLDAWMDAADLAEGDWLQTGSGTHVQITALDHWSSPDATVHNLTVEGVHTYHALADETPLLAHNARCRDVVENQAGRFGDLSPGPKEDDLTAHHMPQTALKFLPRKEGGAIVMKHADHALTRTFGGNGGVTKKLDSGNSFRYVLAKDIWDMRRIGQQQYGDPSYYNSGIRDLLGYYRSIGML